MLDKNDMLWVTGDNTHGCLGLGDSKKRTQPVINVFFDNKRVLDFACGDNFTVVIAEVYDLTQEELRQYFISAKEKLTAMQEGRDIKLK